MELYTRQEQLELYYPNKITVVGCGGIGSWVAILSAMSGIPKITIFDPDVMEESNRNRLPFCTGSLGLPKVEVVKNYIKVIRPECVLIPVQDRLDGVLLEAELNNTEAILECTDSPKSQFTIYKACKSMGRGFIRAGYDGTHISVTSVVSGWIKTDIENEEYTVNPSWVVPAVTVAALAVGKMMKYFAQEVSLDISEIGSPLKERTRRITDRCKDPKKEED